MDNNFEHSRFFLGLQEISIENAYEAFAAWSAYHNFHRSQIELEYEFCDWILKQPIALKLASDAGLYCVHTEEF